jgi:hypothetical protein
MLQARMHTKALMLTRGSKTLYAGLHAAVGWVSLEQKQNSLQMARAKPFTHGPNTCMSSSRMTSMACSQDMAHKLQGTKQFGLK